MIKRGEIYLVNFGKKYNSEFGKIRPALIIQNDIANRNIDKVDFKGITLLPLTTNISGGNLRVVIDKKDNLDKISEVCVNEICTLDLSRINIDNKLTTISKDKLSEVEAKLKSHLEL